jgi:23S rRNA (pseudouridine1915-N3)-methyltransferase
LAFLIGGADGLGEEALSKADLRLSLGPMILPHGLARIVLTEQIYRAETILAGHPYHRG